MRRAAIVLCLALAASICAAAEAAPYAHQRQTSIYGPSPAYWRIHREARIQRHWRGSILARLNPADARIRQLDPRLRSGGDGNLAEALTGEPRPYSELSREYGFPTISGVPPVAYLRNGKGRHRFFRRGR
jgi:hypothetical protein